MFLLYVFYVDQIIVKSLETLMTCLQNYLSSVLICKQNSILFQLKRQSACYYAVVAHIMNMATRQVVYWHISYDDMPLPVWYLVLKTLDTITTDPLEINATFKSFYSYINLNLLQTTLKLTNFFRTFRILSLMLTLPGNWTPHSPLKKY